MARRGDRLGARRALLENWETERQHFVYGMPRALLLYQDTDEILAASTRARSCSTSWRPRSPRTSCASYKLHFRDGEPVAGGAVPGYGDADTEAMFALLNNYTVLSLAQNLALLRVPGATGPEDPRVADAARKLLLTEDFAVATRISALRPRGRRRLLRPGPGRADLGQAGGRLQGGALRGATCCRSTRRAPTAGSCTSDASNGEALGRIPGFEELFAAQSVPDVAEMALKAGIQRTGAHA